MPEQVRHDEGKDSEASPADAFTDLADRIGLLEGRVEEQDDALRRVLTLLVDWVEADDRAAPPVAPAATQPVPIRGTATWFDAA